MAIADQVAPFQCSERVLSGPRPVPLNSTWAPTAQISPAVTTAIALLKMMLPAPPGFWLATWWKSESQLGLVRGADVGRALLANPGVRCTRERTLSVLRSKGDRPAVLVEADAGTVSTAVPIEATLSAAITLAARRRLMLGTHVNTTSMDATPRL